MQATRTGPCNELQTPSTPSSPDQPTLIQARPHITAHTCACAQRAIAERTPRINPEPTRASVCGEHRHCGVLVSPKRNGPRKSFGPQHGTDPCREKRSARALPALDCLRTHRSQEPQTPTHQLCKARHAAPSLSPSSLSLQCTRLARKVASSRIAQNIPRSSRLKPRATGGLSEQILPNKLHKLRTTGVWGEHARLSRHGSKSILAHHTASK